MMDYPQAIRRDWWRDEVTIGRLAAAVVVVLGAALAIWNAIDVGEARDELYGPQYALRTSIHEVLTVVWYGALVLIVAEIVNSIRSAPSGAGSVNGQISRLIRILAALIIFGGTALTIWDVQAMHNLYESPTGFLNLFSRGPGRTVSDDIRYLMEQELQTYLWQGGLLILLAALADRIGPDSGDVFADDGGSLAGPESEI